MKLLSTALDGLRGLLGARPRLRGTSGGAGLIRFRPGLEALEPRAMLSTARVIAADVAVFNGTYRVNAFKGAFGFPAFDVTVSGGQITAPAVVNFEGVDVVVLNHVGTVSAAANISGPRRVTAHVMGQFDLSVPDGPDVNVMYRGSALFFFKKRVARANGRWDGTFGQISSTFGSWQATRIAFA